MTCSMRNFSCPPHSLSEAQNSHPVDGSLCSSSTCTYLAFRLHGLVCLRPSERVPARSVKTTALPVSGGSCCALFVGVLPEQWIRCDPNLVFDERCQMIECDAPARVLVLPPPPLQNFQSTELRLCSKCDGFSAKNRYEMETGNTN